MHKTWNVRDQTEEGLRLEAERLYKQIENGYKLMKKVSNAEDAYRDWEKIDQIYHILREKE